MHMKAGLVGGEGFAIDASVIEADASLRRKAEGKLTAWPDEEDISRPVREYLDALDQAAATEAKPAMNSDDDMPPGNAASEPQVTSLTDPAAAWTSKGRTKLSFAYGTNYLIDNKLAIIVDVEATPARWQVEVAATKTMLERTKERFGLHPQRLAGRGYRLRIWSDDRLADAQRDRAACAAPGSRTTDAGLFYASRF